MSDKSAYIKMLCGTRHALKEAQAYQTKEFLGGKDKNEIRNCYYETDFINVHISC